MRHPDRKAFGTESTSKISDQLIDTRYLRHYDNGWPFTQHLHVFGYARESQRLPAEIPKRIRMNQQFFWY